MKRKILSLALVLMMVISMIPMGAFAAADTTASQFASKVSVDKTSVTADNDTTAEFTIYTYKSVAGNVTSVDADVLFASSRGGSDSFTVTSGTAITVGTTVVGATPTAGKITVKVKSGTAGTSKFGFFLADTGTDPSKAVALNDDTNKTASSLNATKILNGVTTSDINATTYKQIGTQDITFTADSTGKLMLKSAPISYQKKDDPTALNASPKANNINYWQLEVQAVTTGGTPIAGEKVEFSADSTNVSFDSDSIVTDGAGIAKVKVYATKAGDYKITAKTSSKTLEWATTTDLATGKDTRMKLNFLPSGATDLKLASDNNAKIATENNKKIKFRLLDSNGNQYKINSSSTLTDVTHDGTGNTVKVEVVKEPAGSSLTMDATGSDGRMTYDDTNGWSTPSTGKYAWSYGDDYLKLNVNPKKEGDYTLRVYLANGKKVEYNFTATKQGTVTKLNFAYTQAIVPYNSKVSIDTLDKVDANGITTDFSAGSKAQSDFYFSTSDASVATVDLKGNVTFVDDKDNVGKKVTITTTEKTNRLTASYEMACGGKLSTIKAVAPASAEVGKDASVKVKYVDNKGNDVGFNAGGNGVTVESYVVEKPAGAIVGTEASPSFSGDMDSYGNATYFISSNKPGTVKVQIIVTMPNDTRLSDIVTLNFGAAATVANKSIILTMGSTLAISNNAPASLDLAPFIKDGRAFVPVSFVSAQLGGKADFTKKADGTVDTVTVTVGGAVATIKIGDTAIKVVKDGKETTVTSDVAAFIKNGRTVLPFRALSDVVGAKATYGMKADNSGVEWVKFEQ